MYSLSPGRMLVLILFFLNIPCSRASSLRVWGGRDTLPNEYPYVVSMEAVLAYDPDDKYEHQCTGSALTISWTLTAGHCIDIPPHLIKKNVIRYAANGKMLRSDILRTVAHKNMKVSTTSIVNADIALVKSEDIKLPYYARLSAVDYSTFVGGEGVSAGFGLMNTSGGSWLPSSCINKTLQIVDVMFTKCDNSDSTPAVCTTSKCGTMARLCPGDSGGPIIHKSGVVAVHSLGINCGIRQRRLFKYVSIEVPVSPFMDWILNEIST